MFCFHSKIYNHRNVLASASFRFSNKEASLHPTQVPGAEANELELRITHGGVRSVEITAAQPL